ncbi:MOSC domain-containing protein [Halomarina oriensis]|uniref:MOSC domain-containing protein n=1 Tax=Halomarina oriensis TaxID=671145 RepID=A0A6B0GPD3_9EURY|nr:MOSC domain-containing protein [Halomarina oriensis]MWG36726.1 MOSC domain-containing protein [Halomarina oriensis]
MTDDTPRLARLTTYPLKSLDPTDHESRAVEYGTLAGDREYAMVAKPADAAHDPETASVGGQGDYVNGKRTAAVHRLRSSVDREASTVTLREQGGDDARTFSLDAPGELNAYLSDYFDEPVSLRHEPRGGYPDDREYDGPTLVSTATLREVASWFGITVDGARRRFRANLEVDGVPAFWEDRLYADRGEAVAFRVGEVELLGLNPCRRCVVPSRDPDTGEETPGFREAFLRERERTLPPWLDSDRYEGNFRLMVNTRIPESEWGAGLSVGDRVEVLGTRQC